MEISFIILLGSLWGVLGNSTYYSAYYGVPITSDDVAAYTANGTLSNCTNQIAPCNETEGRRIDGTCNNLNYPSRGASHTPYYRILDAEYNQTTPSIFDPRLDQNGNPLSPARQVRRSLISEGRVEDDYITSFATHMAVYFATDITNTRDTSNYVTWRPYCCEEAGKLDYQCVPNEIPADDYVHRFSGERCLNMTRPLTFQTAGCLPNTTVPLRIVEATPTFDGSPIYGNTIETARRNYTGGLLNTETINGLSFPPTTGISLLLGVNFFGIIFFWRLHNYIAKQLAIVNPNWTDEQLFSTAREINIAFAMQMFYYELSPLMMNRERMIADGIISNCTGFRDVYDNTTTPHIFLEYPVILRWWHKMQDGAMKMYYTNGTYFKQYPIVNLTANINFLKEDNNLIYITQGCFRQPCGKIDDFIADPDIVENGLGALQRTNDIMTNDLAKNRYFGFPSYVKYRQYFFGDNITCFDDLTGIIPNERIERIKELYPGPNNLDLLAGSWCESPMTDAYVPPMYYAITAKQMLHSMISDRHWYERNNRPNAFTEAQLAQVRLSSAALLLCWTGDNVTEIQPNAFLMPSYSNVIVSCDEIPALNFSAWAEVSCT